MLVLRIFALCGLKKWNQLSSIKVYKSGTELIEIMSKKRTSKCTSVVRLHNDLHSKEFQVSYFLKVFVSKRVILLQNRYFWSPFYGHIFEADKNMPNKKAEVFLAGAQFFYIGESMFPYFQLLSTCRIDSKLTLKSCWKSARKWEESNSPTLTMWTFHLQKNFFEQLWLKK